LNIAENAEDLLLPLDKANRQWVLTERGRQKKARLRDTAIKTIAKQVSVAGADIASKREERALIRTSIYNALVPAVVALDARRAAIARRQRLWMTAAATSTTLAALAFALMAI
jgi:hypothetical protein